MSSGSGLWWNQTCLRQPTTLPRFRWWMGHQRTPFGRSWTFAGGAEVGSTWPTESGTVQRSGLGFPAVTSWTGTYSGPSIEITPTNPVVRQEAPFEGRVMSGSGTPLLPWRAPTLETSLLFVLQLWTFPGLSLSLFVLFPPCGRL